MAKIKAKHYREQTCCGTIQDAKYNARAAKGNKPQPWIALKLTIGMSMAIIGYTGYVYIGRFCVPMILRQQHALGGRTIGGEKEKVCKSVERLSRIRLVVFLVIFCILALMLFWTYTKVSSAMSFKGIFVLSENTRWLLYLRVMPETYVATSILLDFTYSSSS